MARLGFEFVGTTSTKLSLDINEFRGMSIGEITESVKKTLADISPGVSFYEDDIVIAADALSTPY